MKKTTALTKAKPTHVSITNVESNFKTAIMGISAMLSDRNITPTDLTTTMVTIKEYQSRIAKLEALAKEHLKAVALEKGEKRADTGQVFATFGDYQVELRVQNTKLDDDKVEAMLREKNISIEAGMDKEIRYKHSESKLADLVNRKKISQDELEACRHELKYNLQTPKKVAQGDTSDEELH